MSHTAGGPMRSMGIDGKANASASRRLFVASITGGPEASA